MVERDEGGGSQRQDVPGLRGAPERGAFSETGACVPWCCDQTLAPGARAAQGHPCDCHASEAIPESELDDSWRRCAFLMVCQKDTALGEVFPNRLVHGIAAWRIVGSEVVDGQPGDGDHAA